MGGSFSDMALKLDLQISELERYSPCEISDLVAEIYPDFTVEFAFAGYIGSSYPVDEIDIDEILMYRDDYDVSGKIMGQLDISEDRVIEIDDGADLTQSELDALIKAFAEGNPEDWIGYHILTLECLDGVLFAIYTSRIIGQGGLSFEIDRIFSTKKAAAEYFSTKPLACYDAYYMLGFNAK